MWLCAFYLITAIGIGLNMHYCSGKLSAVVLMKPAKCGACKGDQKASEKHDCCEDASVDIKVKDSHEASFKVKLPQDFSLELFIGKMVCKPFLYNAASLSSRTENKAPPLSAVIALHIYNCVFRN